MDFLKPRIVMGKYLKMVYICHECRETINKSDLNLDGILDILDLGFIFKKPCDPEKVKKMGRGKKGVDL